MVGKGQKGESLWTEKTFPCCTGNCLLSPWAEWVLNRRKGKQSGIGRCFPINSFDALKVLTTTINTSKLQPPPFVFTLIITLIDTTFCDPFSFEASPTPACLRSRVCCHLHLPPAGRPDSSFPPSLGLHSHHRPASLQSSTTSGHLWTPITRKVLSFLLATTEIV